MDTLETIPTADLIFFIVVYSVAFIIVVYITGWILGVPELVKQSKLQTKLLQELIDKINTGNTAEN